MSAVLLSFVALAAANPASLTRGGPLTVQAGTRLYWAVEDTTLDAAEPDTTLGGMAILGGGPDRTILIKFGDLRRALGPQRKITKATLKLTPTGGGQAVLAGAYRMLRPWNEGPMRTLSALSGNSEMAAPWSSTWRMRRAGNEPVPWADAGGLGAGDALLLEGIQATAASDESVSISGFAGALQAQYDRPWDNHGFALRFAQPIDFFSSQSMIGRPVLEVETEAAAPSTGADLAVVSIARTPEYDRYASGGVQNAQQDGVDVPVQGTPPNALDKKWPLENEKVTYTATVKNVGTAASSAFTGRWMVRETPGQPVVGKPLAPGETLTFTFEKPFRNLHSDHRNQPLELRLTPEGVDADPANDALKIEEAALSLGIWVEQSVIDKLKNQPNLFGTGFEAWVQGIVGTVNEAVFPYSRFSFAPDGVLERVRIQSIEVVQDGALDANGLLSGRQNLKVDAEIGFRASDALDPNSIPPGLLRRLGRALGLADLSNMAIPAGDERLKPFGLNRGALDMYPGIMGGGDTRFEGALPPSIPIPYEPAYDQVASVAQFEATDLFSATDVAALNVNLGRRRGYTGEYLYDLPPSILVTCVDFNGRRLPKASLSFYQTAGGVLRREASFFATTSDTGTTILRARDPQLPVPITTMTGHSLKPNVFGRIDPEGRNGLFLVKAVVGGMEEWGWLKLWQAVDTYHRGQRGVALMTLRFNLPGMPLEAGSDVAKDRLVVSSDNAPAAQLSKLTDGEELTDSALPEAKDSWIEIDLGRDRAVGEIRLLAAKGAPMWEQFEIKVYGTGERPEDARPWSREYSWVWSAANRSDRPDIPSVPYRGNAQRFRFIRIVSKTGGPARLTGVQITPVVIAGG